MSKIDYVDQNGFSDAIGGGITLISFTAVWAGPCKAMEPILESLQEESNGKYKILKVDVDESPTLVEQFKIRSVPCLILFKAGKEVKRQVGKASREKLLEMFE